MIAFSESKRTYTKNACGIYRPDPLNYHPIRKGLKFDPQPVAGNIPWYADIVKNPLCETTPACIDFWEEQFDYCINGYTTGGIFIPGRYYFFLNFRVINGLFGKQYPWFVDNQYEYALVVEWVKANKWLGVLAPKARRKGLSEEGVNILEHGARFIDGYKGGICAGISNYVEGFKTKMDVAAQEIRPELKLSVLTDNTKQLEFGYRVRNLLGQIEDDGSHAKILMATMYDDPKKFEGEYFHDVIFEESGEFPLLESTLSSIKPALMMGSEIGGTCFIYGTGGNILSSSKGFKALYDQSDLHKLARFEVVGQRMIYPFIGLSKNVKDRHLRKKLSPLKEEMPSFTGWKDYERVGCEDVWRGEQWIIEEDERIQQLGDKKKLREHRQNFPRSVEDIFTSAGKNSFDADTLYYALNLTMQEEPHYDKVVMDFEKVKDGFGQYQIKQPLAVTIRPYKESDPEWKMVYILKGQVPSAILNMDTGGTDAYESNDTLTSSSKMGVIVWRDFRFAPQLCPMAEQGIILPVCGYYARPPKRELAFEMSLKISVYWNLVRNMMLSAEHESCLEYYQKNQGIKYLSFRPRIMDSPDGKQIHRFGVKMTVYSKPKTIGQTGDFILRYAMYWRLEFLIRDYLAYDEENIGTDWDAADAGMSGITRINDRRGVIPSGPQEESESSGIDNNQEITYYYNKNGILVAKIPPPVPEKTKNKKQIEPSEDYMFC